MGKRLFIAVIITLLVLFIGCTKEPVKTAQGYWDSAREYFNNGDYEKTVREYQKLVKYYPQDTLTVRTLFAVAEIYKNNLKDYDNSIGSYNKIIEQYADHSKAPNAMFMIGYIYANDLNDLDNAKKSYTKFIEAYPDHMLVPSANWEIQNLGKSLDEIPQLQTITKGSN